ncbi:MAG: ATP-binding cassette domain-containing protein [Woeseiaceae bacterium]|nr:ATP-binding cassette domain-containing protein [Woeseiaceae bacterium]
MSAISEPPLIEIRNATIWRGNTRVFENFNLSIAQHEQVAVLGPERFRENDAAQGDQQSLKRNPVANTGSSVRILGRETWNVWELRSHIGIVSHDLQTRYKPTTSGLDVVLSGYLSSVGIHGLLARRISRDQVDRAHAVLAELGIAALAKTPLGRMSTGQQRRCLLARALVHDPHTLILDEPTAGLDLAASFDYLARIRQLVRAGKTIVLVTHALHEIPPVVGRVILLREGRIVADGVRDDVLTTGQLEATFGVSLRVARIDGYVLAYPPADDA